MRKGEREHVGVEELLSPSSDERATAEEDAAAAAAAEAAVATAARSAVAPSLPSSPIPRSLPSSATDATNSNAAALALGFLLAAVELAPAAVVAADRSAAAGMPQPASADSAAAASARTAALPSAARESRAVASAPASVEEKEEKVLPPLFGLPWCPADEDARDEEGSSSASVVRQEAIAPARRNPALDTRRLESADPATASATSLGAAPTGGGGKIGGAGAGEGA